MKNRITGRKVDYSSMSNLPNVDTLCDVLSVTQTEMGLESQMKEAEYDKVGKRISRYKRNEDGNVVDNRTGEVITFQEREFPILPRTGETSNYKSVVRIVSKQPEKSVSDKDDKSEKKKQGIVDLGFSEWFDRRIGGYTDDDDSDEYICEWCTELGYSGKYKAHICDNCTKCETCSEFENGKCDGCTYSKSRTGKLYSETLSVDEIVDSDDLKIIQDITKDKETTRRKLGNFTILDY